MPVEVACSLADWGSEHLPPFFGQSIKRDKEREAEGRLLYWHALFLEIACCVFSMEGGY